MNKNTYFKVIFNRFHEETAIKNYLERVSNILKIDDLEGLGEEYSTYVNNLPLYSHFEIIYSNIPLGGDGKPYLSYDEKGPYFSFVRSITERKDYVFKDEIK